MIGSSPLARGTRSGSTHPPPDARFIPARAGNTGRSPGGCAPAPVHPRSRGEHGRSLVPMMLMAGSSPLARGTPSAPGHHHRGRRFIPARAGNTRTGTWWRSSTSVHPRSRGEHRRHPDTIIEADGSSPLARGTLHRPAPRPGRPRFIPARAGNTDASERVRARSTVHPRSRGEHSPSPGTVLASAGSSPLARGTPSMATSLDVHPRFIPARAGNTVSGCRRTSDTGVHPRSRGEHVISAHIRSRAVGSSPLARGTPVRSSRLRAWIRFIPARAGNTGNGASDAGPRPVHPRSRGEHRMSRRHHKGKTGSSPLARGTRLYRGESIGHRRFIPARAGNTRPPTATDAPAPVHPRSRGEHTQLPFAEQIAFGSSPLARGTRAAARETRPVGRFIPARAGNTRPPTASCPPPPVHPRSRGEHGYPLLTAAACDGSSPLARRTPGQHDPERADHRFIPARAGNTHFREIIHDLPPVHPRSRGEHAYATRADLVARGSSPLARGTRDEGQRAIVPLRFIPARAGNTIRTAWPPGTAPVHPRSRGEHPGCGRGTFGSGGSSPLARGTRRSTDARLHPRRFIPARAGNTLAPSSSKKFTPVHPRSRGEHVSRRCVTTWRSGSSPLARGTRGEQRDARRRARFIPARAGNTSRARMRASSAPVHPRSRGEHGLRSGSVRMLGGSSPLARGTHGRPARGCE